VSAPTSHTRRGAFSTLAAVAVAGLTLTALPNSGAATASSTPHAKSPSPVVKGVGERDRKGFYDAGDVSPPGAIAPAEKVLGGAGQAHVAQLRAALGPSAIVDIDPLTGTPRNLTALNRYLTTSSSSSARSVAMTYVRQHLAELGLRSSDLGTLRLTRSYVDPAGIHHLAWTQSVDGITVFGNGLEAHVTKHGQLISLQGSPVSGLDTLAAGVSTRPALTAASARAASAKDVGAPLAPGSERFNRSGEGALWSNGDRVTPVWFVDGAGLRLAWSTYTRSGEGQDYAHVVDAQTGKVLYRRDLVDNDQGDARVYDYFPGANHGGKAHVVNFVKRGWVSRSAGWLHGANVDAWADLNDDNLVNHREKTPVPGTKKSAQYTLHAFDSNRLCSKRFICTWNPNKADSWRTNKKADVTNAFYLANTFHDYLAKKPIGFKARAGNFERADGDPLQLNALDGADTAHGLPDGNHIDNANMSTPPDGTPPRMQMYLWHFPHTPNSVEPYVPMSGAFDASILYHEYTHGLSNRLVVDAQGNSTLNSIQAGAMGEAWSDYYAMDYLVTKGFQPDSRKRDGQILEGKYTLANKFTFRTMAMDCKIHSTARNCKDPITGKRGGYTYGDFPRIGGSPEVHSSGEVWSQTLWNIREKFGHKVADSIITRAMELSPNDPTMLDMRNAIVQADKVVFNNRHTTGLWKIFAHRGMGWYAGAIDGGDTQPAQDFHTPPAPYRGVGTLFGLVIDHGSGDPIAGARVTITGHPGYTSRTGANGVYEIDNVKPGVYKKVVATGAGHEVVVRKIDVPGGDNAKRIDFQTRRDWASSEGGGQITDFDGPDFSSFGCGPPGAIDLSQGTIWGSTTGDDAGSPTNVVQPKSLTVQLPQPVDIGTGSGLNAAFKIDPTAGCGDAGSASTGDFTLEVSPNGTTWTTVVDRSGQANWLPRFRFTNLTASQAVANVQFVRLTINGPQVPDFATSCPGGNFSGCSFMDFTELEVFGTP
jgi:extracellular elastinolytic metalloproteinase